MTHSNIDLRIYTRAPESVLGCSQYPLRPNEGKGSRPRDWPICQCGSRAESCGTVRAREGRFALWYTIRTLPACSDCWLTIYDEEGEEEYDHL
jgi:hypothetical protein